MANQVTLPQELVCCILDQCGLDTPALQACSLVSRSWFPVAQRLLFSLIRVNNNFPERNILAFSQFLETNTIVREYVRRIYINHGRAVQEISEAAARLPLLHELDINFVELHPPPFNDQPALLASALPGHLKSLRIISCRVFQIRRPWDLLFSLINVFSSIDFMLLCDVESFAGLGGVFSPVKPPTAPPITPPLRKTKVGCLTFWAWFNPHVEQLMMHTFAWTEVESLNMDAWPSEGHWLCQSMIDMAAPGLKSLGVSLTAYKSPFARSLSLALCTNLQSVTFIIPLNDSILESNIALLQEDFSLTLASLSSIPPSSLRLPNHLLGKVCYTIEFISILFNSDDAVRLVAENVDWSILASALQLFERLASLNMSFRVPTHLSRGQPVVLFDVVRRQLDRTALARKFTMQAHLS